VSFMHRSPATRTMSPSRFSYSIRRRGAECARIKTHGQQKSIEGVACSRLASRRVAVRDA
jgi:hypothetical protein